MERVSTNRATTEARPVLAGDVMGYSLFRVAPGDVPALRRKPGPMPEGWVRVPPSLLRNSDEQTVAGTAAVLAAIEAMDWHPDRFGEWGVVGASRFLGRANLATALRSFIAEGVWGTSPHLIPHFALHSPSGTISLALGSQGPNLGVGGGLYAAAEGFLAALTWLAAGVVPGVWLVFSGWAPELAPLPDGESPASGECLALAVALVARGSVGRRPAFRAFTATAGVRASAPLDLEWLAAMLASPCDPSPRTIATDYSGRLRIELFDGSDGPG
jgi:hypothetical protein